MNKVAVVEAAVGAAAAVVEAAVAAVATTAIRAIKEWSIIW